MREPAWRKTGSTPDYRFSLANERTYAAWLRTYADPGFNDYMASLLERLQRFADAHDVALRQPPRRRHAGARAKTQRRRALRGD